MTETTVRPSGGLSTLKLDELKTLATSMGISGTTRMRKSDLVDAITARRGAAAGASRPAQDSPQNDRPASAPRADQTPAPQDRGTESAADDGAPGTDGGAPARTRRRAASRGTGAPTSDPSVGSDHGEAEGAGDGNALAAIERAVELAEARRGQGGNGQGGASGQGGQSGAGNREGDRREGQGDRREGGYQQRGQGGTGNRSQQGGGQSQGQQGQGHQGQSQQGQGQRQNRFEDDDRPGRRRSRQRSRDRKRGRGPQGQVGPSNGDYESDIQVAEDDVLVPVGGILDVLDSYAFVRTSGYLPGNNDVYVSLGMVKRYGLRKGDAVTGQVKANADGEQAHGNRQKFNALVRLDTVNGGAPEAARNRVEFSKLTPLYPQERLRLETTPNIITTRVIDLVSPIGKGQRGLIVSPPKAGKTMIMQAIANAISVNNPEVHLMVVLVDERPEEVTDFQRSVKGEVIASTFDRPASDHTIVAELAIERAKRLVELGHDVVILLDGITRLSRAYNLAAPASGRILSGGVDSSALYPPKKFFGAARNIENGGSLTILATGVVETGSKMDEVIFEEFKGTGNMELRLSRQLADRRIFPAVDATASGTRREEILMGGDELKIMWKLRRVLSALDQQQALELLVDRLKKTGSNVEFLMQVHKTSSIQIDDDDM